MLTILKKLRKSATMMTNLCKDAGVSVKEVFIQDGVIVGERLRQPAQPGRWDLLEGGLVRLEPDAAHVQRDPVLPVLHHRQPTMGFAGFDLS